LGIAARRTAAFTARCHTSGATWCRRSLPLRGAIERVAAGKTYGQIQSCDACGYFRSKAYGKYTLPNPSPRSQA